MRATVTSMSPLFQYSYTAPIEIGHKILWHLDVGSFKEMSFSLKDEAQGASLDLSIRHFLDNVWDQFQEHSMGVLLYQGGIDFYEAGILRSDFDDDFEMYVESVLEEISK